MTVRLARLIAGVLALTGLFKVSAWAVPEKTMVIADPTYGRPIPHLTPWENAAAAAHWIWLGPVAGDRQVNVRTVLTLRFKPRTAQVWATGGDAFTLSINARQVEQTPPAEQGWSHPRQDIVTPYLHAGRNVLAVTGVNKGGGAAGLLVGLDVNNIPGYTASWFGTMADFYRHAGDLPFLQSQHQNILTLLAYQQTEFDTRNLFANPQHEWDFCDWGPGYVQNMPRTLATTDLFDIYGVRQAVFLLWAMPPTPTNTAPAPMR